MSDVMASKGTLFDSINEVTRKYLGYDLNESMFNADPKYRFEGFDLMDIAIDPAATKDSYTIISKSENSYTVVNTGDNDPIVTGGDVGGSSALTVTSGSSAETANNPTFTNPALNNDRYAYRAPMYYQLPYTTIVGGSGYQYQPYFVIPEEYPWLKPDRVPEADGLSDGCDKNPPRKISL